VHGVDWDGMRVVLDLLGKAVGQAREPARTHADRQVGAINETGADTGLFNTDAPEVRCERSGPARRTARASRCQTAAGHNIVTANLLHPPSAIPAQATRDP
jgi:hypothetical protein